MSSHCYDYGNKISDVHCIYIHTPSSIVLPSRKFPSTKLMHLSTSSHTKDILDGYDLEQVYLLLLSQLADVRVHVQQELERKNNRSRQLKISGASCSIMYELQGSDSTDGRWPGFGAYMCQPFFLQLETWKQYQ